MAICLSEVLQAADLRQINRVLSTDAPLLLILKDEFAGMIIPPYFDGPVFNDDYGIDLAKTEEPEPVKPSKVPELPVEVYHTQPFNASAAWEAVRALSRGA